MTHFKNQIKESIRIIEGLGKQEKLYLALVHVISGCLRRGKKVILFGNGGSSADAMHWAAEITGAFYNRKRKSLPAIALASNPAEITSIANDFGFEEVFAKPVQALTNPGDVVIGISTSGKSRNVLRGLEAAKKRKGICIGFTGRNSYEMRKRCRYVFAADSADTARIQEAHEFFAHAVLFAVERKLFD